MKIKYSLNLQDIRAGHGLAVIDPHGDLVEPILGKIPRERCRDVIYFINMLDREYPLGFNLLEWQTLMVRDMIVDDLYLPWTGSTTCARPEGRCSNPIFGIC